MDPLEPWQAELMRDNLLGLTKELEDRLSKLEGMYLDDDPKDRWAKENGYLKAVLATTLIQLKAYVK